jgi:hypothetical protein
VTEPPKPDPMTIAAKLSSVLPSAALSDGMRASVAARVSAHSTRRVVHAIAYDPDVLPKGKGRSSEVNQWGVVTTVTPLKWWRLPWLRLVFVFGNRTEVAIKRLKDMRVIYLARWTFLPNRREPKYLVFETNWAGQEQSYIPDLAMLMQFQWKSIFGAVKGFPGPVPTTELLAFIKTKDWGADHVWTNYRGRATTKTVVTSLELQPCFERFVRDARGLPPDLLAVHWRRFATEHQELLQP